MMIKHEAKLKKTSTYVYIPISSPYSHLLPPPSFCSVALCLSLAACLLSERYSKAQLESSIHLSSRIHTTTMAFIVFLITSASILRIFSTFFLVHAAPIGLGLGNSLSSRDDSYLDITQYLAAHNVIRALHDAPSLIWSDDLATGAQAWANACNFKHSDGVLSELPYGENIAAATGDFGINAAVESFMSDEGDFLYAPCQ